MVYQAIIVNIIYHYFRLALIPLWRVIVWTDIVYLVMFYTLEHIKHLMTNREVQYPIKMVEEASLHHILEASGCEQQDKASFNDNVNHEKLKDNEERLYEKYKLKQLF